MAPDPEALQHRRPDGEDTEHSTSVDPREHTPLLRPFGGDESQRALEEDAPAVGADKVIGWKRVTCIIASMWVLIFLQASNMSGMSVTQSIIAADLDAYEDAMWFTSAYLIAVASVSPVVGRLSMIFSPASMILAASAVFAAGALATSQARTFSVFMFGRVLLGAGAGGVLTLSLILILLLAKSERHGLFIGLVNAGFTIGVSTGAVVFGALVSTLGWRALFGMQAPIGLIAGLGVHFSMPRLELSGNLEDKTVLQKLAKIDYAGAISLTISIVLFLYGLSGTVQMVPIVLSLAGLLGFLAIEHFVASDPIVPLSVLGARGVLFSCLTQFVFMAARWTVLFFAPIFVLAVRGLGPAVAGSVLIPTNAGFGSGSILVGWLHVRHAQSFWTPSLVSLMFFGATLYCLSFLSTAATPAWLYVLAVFLNGFATGASLTYNLAHMMHVAAVDARFIATGLQGTFRGFAGSFGAAIGGGVFTRTLRAALTRGFEALDGGDDRDESGSRRRELITKLVGSPALVFGGGLSDAERAVAVQGYEYSLSVLYRATALFCVLALATQAMTGWRGPLAKDEDEEEYGDGGENEDEGQQREN